MAPKLWVLKLTYGAESGSAQREEWEEKECSPIRGWLSKKENSKAPNLELGLWVQRWSQAGGDIGKRCRDRSRFLSKGVSGTKRVGGPWSRTRFVGLQMLANWEKESQKEEAT